MTDYKETLNLPQTAFPMKANLPQCEPEMLQYWESADIYQKLRLARKNRETFVLHDGPPYANGNIHLGHAVNKILKDIVLKSKTLSGFDAPYIPGWDCHGLPIELNVEKKIGKPGEKVTAAEFRAACRKYANTQIDLQRTSFQRLGVLGNWNNPYTTMDYSYEAEIVRSLANIIEHGHLERGSKPVYWCLDCGSALAEAEVEYQDKTSSAIDVRFKVTDETALLERFATGETFEKASDICVPIWTTTPWTLPANQAVALHPDVQYALVECVIEQKRERLIIAKILVETVLKRYGAESFQTLAHCQGKALEGLALQHPFYDRTVPIILAEHVTTETGTGAVHTAPGHGLEDYLAGQQYHLPIDNPVDDHGYFLPDTPIFGGESIYKANPHIIDVLREHSMLLDTETVTHSYPHCWRHKTPLIFRATPQWFISMDKNHLRDTALAEIKKVDWIPKWGETRITNMVKLRPDWCISRQRTWFVPIMLFVHKETGELHPDHVQLMRAAADLVEKKGIEIWDILDPQTLLGEEGKNYQKVNDALDVWFDSGVTHTCVLKKREALRFPADLYLEGSDQYRGWFQSSLLTSCAMFGETPYKQILTHGFTIDAKGRKMSKSLGNVIAPDQIIKTFGADILRLWVASTDYQSDIVASDDTFQHTVDVYRRIRNTARFLLANLHDFDPLVHMIAPKNMLALDNWIVDKTRLLQEEIQNAYHEYQFHFIAQKIHHFCAMTLGSFYLDIIKDRQYTTKKDGIPRRSAQTAIYHMINALVRWIAPILSFTAEEIWKQLIGNFEESVFLTTWYLELAELPKNTAMNQAYFENVILIRDAVNKEIEHLRAQGLLGSALEAEVTLYADPYIKKLLSHLKDELRFILITSNATVLTIEQAPKEAVQSEIDGLKLKIEASQHKKCERCWHRRNDVGENSDHPNICKRCVENIEGSGEIRQFA
jgi:isoleucyl-tRNA synthetase